MKTCLYSVTSAFVLLGFLICNQARAQDGGYETETTVKTEFAVLGGGSIYFGDLAAEKRDYLKESRLHGGLFIRHFFGRGFSVRGNVYFGQLEGNDAWYNEPAWRKHRNFAFKSLLCEVSGMLEYDILRALRLEKRTGIGIYVFVGAGACYTNPQRNFSSVDVAYFGTQDDAVSGYQADFSRDPGHVALVVPVGAGLRRNIGNSAAVFVEGGMRQGFDDKIDGFSKSISSDKYDAYAFLSIGLLLTLQQRDN